MTKSEAELSLSLQLILFQQKSTAPKIFFLSKMPSGKILRKIPQKRKKDELFLAARDRAEFPQSWPYK